MPITDKFELKRFLDAQQNTYQRALEEIRRGRKITHWMWFVFPQLVGLGRSAMAQHYGIRSLAEARAYLEHPVLGKRLRECVDALQDLDCADPQAVFGSVDAMKLNSSLTLFEKATGPQSVYSAALQRWYGGSRDGRTLELLD